MAPSLVNTVDSNSRWRTLNAAIPISIAAGPASHSDFCLFTARLSQKLGGTVPHVHLQSAAAIKLPAPQPRSPCAGRRVLPAAK